MRTGNHETLDEPPPPSDEEIARDLAILREDERRNEAFIAEQMYAHADWLADHYDGHGGQAA